MAPMKVTPVSIVIPIRNIQPDSLEFWFQEREEDGPLNGFLEFPGGKIEAGEDSVTAGKREVLEETGVSLEDQLKLFKIYPFQYSDRRVSLFVHLYKGEFRAQSGQWIKLSVTEPLIDIKERVLEANHLIIKEVVGFLYSVNNT